MNKATTTILKDLTSTNYTVGNTGRPASMLAGARTQAAAVELARLGIIAIVQVNNPSWAVCYAVLPRDVDNFICDNFTLVTQSWLDDAAA